MGAYFTLFLGRLQLRIVKNYKKTFRPQQRAECFSSVLSTQLRPTRGIATRINLPLQARRQLRQSFPCWCKRPERLRDLQACQQTC